MGWFVDSSARLAHRGNDLVAELAAEIRQGHPERCQARAFCGCEAARYVIPTDACITPTHHPHINPLEWHLSIDNWSAKYWAAGLASVVPVHRVEYKHVWCEGKGHYLAPGSVVSSIKVTCADCHGTGKIIRDVPGWYCIVAAEAVGRAVLPGWESEQRNSRGLDDLQFIAANSAPRRALDNVACWIDDPSEKNRQACHIENNSHGGGSAIGGWVSAAICAPQHWQHWSSIEITQAAKQLPTWREVASAAVLRGLM